MDFMLEVKVQDDEMKTLQLEDMQQDGISDDLEPEENSVEQTVRSFF